MIINTGTATITTPATTAAITFSEIHTDTPAVNLTLSNADARWGSEDVNIWASSVSTSGCTVNVSASGYEASPSPTVTINYVAMSNR